jgi:hypothetical protein
MAINPAELEHPTVLDVGAFCERLGNPAQGARDIREKIVQQLERMFAAESYHDEAEAALAAGEISKDVVVHGDATESMSIVVEPTVDGVILSSISVEARDEDKPLAEKDPDCHGFGEHILKRMYGYDYTSISNGNVFERHLLIRGDIDLELPTIRHNK